MIRSSFPPNSPNFFFERHDIISSSWKLYKHMDWGEYNGETYAKIIRPYTALHFNCLAQDGNLILKRVSDWGDSQ